MRASLYEFGYDGADQLLGALDRTTGSSPTVLKRFAYSYDKAGNRITEQIDDNVTSANYDTLNRLTSRSGGGVLAFKGTVNEPATLTIQGKSVNVDSTNQFSG